MEYFAHIPILVQALLFEKRFLCHFYMRGERRKRINNPITLTLSSERNISFHLSGIHDIYDAHILIAYL